MEQLFNQIIHFHVAIYNKNSVWVWLISKPNEHIEEGRITYHLNKQIWWKYNRQKIFL